jgi:iron complex outermembrane receptor protein
MRKSLAVLSLALLGSALAAEPEGGDASLEELLRQELRQPSGDLAVSTAARMAQSGAAAPGVTHVVTRQDIQRLGLRNLADILQLLPGVYLTRDGLFTQMGVRGLGRPGDLNARVLFLLDGMRLNENIYYAGQIDQDFLVDVSEIERVSSARVQGRRCMATTPLWVCCRSSPSVPIKTVGCDCVARSAPMAAGRPAPVLRGA